MPDFVENAVVNASGAVQQINSYRAAIIYVLSSEIIPKGMVRGSKAIIIDKAAALAFCDGNDNWYMEADKPVQAGQTWAALFG